MIIRWHHEKNNPVNALLRYFFAICSSIFCVLMLVGMRPGVYVMLSFISVMRPSTPSCLLSCQKIAQLLNQSALVSFLEFRFFIFVCVSYLCRIAVAILNLFVMLLLCCLVLQGGFWSWLTVAMSFGVPICAAAAPFGSLCFFLTNDILKYSLNTYGKIQHSVSYKR